MLESAKKKKSNQLLMSWIILDTGLTQKWTSWLHLIRASPFLHSHLKKSRQLRTSIAQYRKESNLSRVRRLFDTVLSFWFVKCSSAFCGITGGYAWKCFSCTVRLPHFASKRLFGAVQQSAATSTAPERCRIPRAVISCRGDVSSTAAIFHTVTRHVV